MTSAPRRGLLGLGTQQLEPDAVTLVRPWLFKTGAAYKTVTIYAPSRVNRTIYG